MTERATEHGATPAAEEAAPAGEPSAADPGPADGQASAADGPASAADGEARAGAPPALRQMVQVPPNCDLTLGLVCLDKSVPGRTRWRMRAHERFANPLGVMQGGIIAAFCDSAMGATVVTFAAGRPVRVANTALSVTFLRPVPSGAELTCEAAVVSGGSHVVFAEATVVAGHRRGRSSLVARATSTFLLSERR